VSKKPSPKEIEKLVRDVKAAEKLGQKALQALMLALAPPSVRDAVIKKLKERK
jgi:hypothetical protein